MKIRNKTTGKVMDVTDRRWSNMVYEGSAKRYEVLPVIEPRGFYKGEGVIEKGDDEAFFYPTREAMIEALREQGHTVAHNIGDDKLLTRYKENIESGILPLLKKETI